MPYEPNIIPQAPVPISMLPDAEPLKGNDLLLLTQPLNAQGKSRRLQVKNLSGLDFAPVTMVTSTGKVSSWEAYPAGLTQPPNRVYYMGLVDAVKGYATKLHAEIKFTLPSGTSRPNGSAFTCGLAYREGTGGIVVAGHTSTAQAIFNNGNVVTFTSFSPVVGGAFAEIELDIPAPTEDKDFGLYLYVRTQYSGEYDPDASVSYCTIGATRYMPVTHNEQPILHPVVYTD